MEHRIFVYGTLLRGEVNHRLLHGAELLGAHRTAPCFTMFLVGAYPGLALGGETAIRGEVYRVSEAGRMRLDRLEDYPRLYDRVLIPTPYGRAWVYLYRGPKADRALIGSGDWREISCHAAAVRTGALRNRRDPKNPRHRDRRDARGAARAAK